ncbi:MULTISPECIES: hypothetical protein [Arcobacteraceae]|uniref:Uncharacterized protein n=1 Tax=Poseidonibacter parvus TaxID=1850254 RepID=A0A1P8KMS7_9BACT|nr:MULTISPECIES: hypothetical protein [Arcobacteraceae]APW65874.1 hypothetical protein LPB137_08395 [Poseidonibacter parvus]
MKSKIENILKKSIIKLNNLNKSDIYYITGVVSVLTAFIGTFAFVFGNIILLSLSPLILLTSYHCNFLMENKI